MAQTTVAADSESDSNISTMSRSVRTSNELVRQRINQRRERVYGWMLMGPNEWGFCIISNQPKPPRAHFDHVTRNLVLNMDHYCPWMFNSIGYFNYRYFW